MKQLIVFILLLEFTCCIEAQKASIPISKHKFIVIAHRGDHLAVPENTIDAFKQAIKNGADYVEIDLRTTKDSVLVIMHDATVDRMTNGKGRISDLNYAELRQLKVMDKKKDTINTYDLPTFEEVLATCKDKIHIYLDFKNASVQQSYNMIKQYGMENQVIVYMNTPFQYKEWRTLVPSMPVMLSLPDTLKNADELKAFVEKYPLEVLDGNYSDYTRDMVQYATKVGKKVWPDIQGPSEESNWDKALEIGFKGLQTDHPKALISYLEKKGLR